MNICVKFKHSFLIGLKVTLIVLFTLFLCKIAFCILT